jgi:hypothetical protein
MVTDDTFSAFADQVEREEQERAERRTGTSFNYEKLKWVGIPKKGCKIVRALDNAPNSNVTLFTSRTYRFSKIRADNGREIHVKLPLEKDDPDHIMWRILKKVLAVDWEDNKKYFVYEKSLPEIFSMVRYNKFPEGSERRKYDKGWSGQDMFVMNCIDRDPATYAWSKENKHTVLLSKNVTVVTDPVTKKVMEFVDPGIPAYGFVTALAHNLFAYYGNWENYDIKIERTGTTTAPYVIANASEHIKEVPANLQPFVVTGGLTEEEQTWERYDLSKLFGITSYTKLFNRLEKSIATIDLALGTHYHEELKSLAQEEEKKAKENKEEISDSFEEEAETKKVPVTMDVPVRASRSPKVETPKEQEPAMPKGYAKLTDEEKSKIAGMRQISGDTWDILYENTGGASIVACSICKTPSPDNFVSCPGCGAMF